VRIRIRHERVISAPPERVAELVSDFEAIWPTQMAPPPRPLGDRRYREGPMVWEEFDRPGAIRAFRVISPEQLRGEHWFEVQPIEGGALIRHTIVGEAVGEYAEIWRDRIEPVHERILEAVLDNIEAAPAQGGSEHARDMRSAHPRVLEGDSSRPAFRAEHVGEPSLPKARRPRTR
jgi:hypothetical protein